MKVVPASSMIDAAKRGWLCKFQNRHKQVDDDVGSSA